MGVLRVTHLEEGARAMVMREGQRHFLAQYDLEDAEIRYWAEQDVVQLRYGGLTFLERPDWPEPADASGVADAALKTLHSICQRAKRKVRRTPRCYYPIKEKA